MNILKLADVFRSRHCFEKSGRKAGADGPPDEADKGGEACIAPEAVVPQGQQPILEIFSGLVWFG